MLVLVLGSDYPQSTVRLLVHQGASFQLEGTRIHDHKGGMIPTPPQKTCALWLSVSNLFVLRSPWQTLRFHQAIPSHHFGSEVTALEDHVPVAAGSDANLEE